MAHSSNAHLTILEDRVDWISCSAKTEPNVRALEAILTEQRGQAWLAGDKPYYFGRNGYKGSGCGHWKAATGPKGIIVEVGGQDADLWSKTLTHYAEHVSRIDYCVTTSFDQGASKVADALYEHYMDSCRLDEKRFNVQQIRKIKKGGGVQFGERTSEYVARVYDKHAESGGLYPPNTWRWEVELKRSASEAEHKAILADETRVDQAVQIVSGVLDRWNVAYPWDETAPIKRAPSPGRVRDAERALQWLRTQVAPTVEWLLALGREQDVREALNLTGDIWQGVA